MIYDARSYLNALANKVMSGGFENTKDYYRDCDLVFCDIDNIHAVRDAITKVHEMGNQTSVNSVKWLSQLEATNWLQLTSKILQAANQVVESITQKQLNVLVHCTDGWDRTAQMCAIA